MMKKVIGIILLLIMGLSVTACSQVSGAGTSSTGQTQNESESEPLEETQQTTAPSEIDASESEQEVPEVSNVLVAYFSCTGTTETMAEYAAETLAADLYEIVPEEPYTEEDLAYYTGGRADQEQNAPSARPAISGGLDNLEQYDTIFLGYPIWHGQAPRIISTFLESYDFSGKTIIPFCTSGSSGIGSSAENLHSLCSESAVWEDGRRFGSGISKDEIADWIQEFNLTGRK